MEMMDHHMIVKNDPAMINNKRIHSPSGSERNIRRKHVVKGSLPSQGSMFWEEDDVGDPGLLLEAEQKHVQGQPTTFRTHMDKVEQEYRLAHGVRLGEPSTSTPTSGSKS